MIPTVISWMPPRSRTTRSTVVMPGTNSPAMRKPIAIGIARKATQEKMKPSTVASCRGRCENDEIASSEKRSMRRGVYFVSPAKRASRSYSTAACSKPTQPVIPRRNRLRSGIASSASRARRSSRR
jgi:hypothetical protein